MPDGLRIVAAKSAPEARAADGLATGSIATKAQKVRAPKPRQPELLASVAISFGKLPALARIAPTYAEIDAGFLDKCLTGLCDNAAATLRTVIDGNAHGDVLALLSAVNRSVNRLITYRRDQDLYGVMDFWAKPSSTLNKGMGDCEDYAILKMAVLAKAGVPARSMSVVILRDEVRNVYHAVTAVQTSSGAYILDNLQRDIRKDSELPNYMPLYSVSAGRGYIYGKRMGGHSLVASAGRLDAIAPGEGLATYGPAAPGTVLMWNGHGPF
jgi:predicted transglutaminase-like cysteine proteinase